MLNSTVLEVAIGLVFCFATVGLFVSSLNEGIAALLNLRAKSLLTGIKQLLNDEKFTGLARQLYDHALVNPLSSGATPQGKVPDKIPSYVASCDFASALIDTIQKGASTFASLQQNIDRIPDAQLKKALTGFADRANQDIDAFRTSVAVWFDGAMDRVSGHYKRRTQLITFVLGFVVAVVLQIDSVHLFKALWAHPGYIAELSNLTSANDGKLDELSKAVTALPLGLEHSNNTPGGAYLACYLPALPGLLITATAAIFGAPFWFDLLQRLVQLRSTGKKPKPAKES